MKFLLKLLCRIMHWAGWLGVIAAAVGAGWWAHSGGDGTAAIIALAGTAVVVLVTWFDECCYMTMAPAIILLFAWGSGERLPYADVFVGVGIIALIWALVGSITQTINEPPSSGPNW